MAARKPRACIICETPTMDRSAPYNDPRCSDWLPCALRRNAGRARPKPEGPIIAEGIEKGCPVTAEQAQVAHAHSTKSARGEMVS